MTRIALLAALGTALCSTGALAQTTIHTLSGSSAQDQLGKSVAPVGDVDADGVDDFAVGEPFVDGPGLNRGAVRVYSGRTGQVLHTFYGVADHDRFGEAVAGAGDVNHDGRADVIVGAPLHDENGASSGMARVFSGADGAVLHTFYGDQAIDWFGAAVDSAGDVDADGTPDLIVGAPYGKGANTANIGMARVFSGADGAVLHTFFSPSGVQVLGTSVSGAGDVDQDGHDDLIVGAPQATVTSNDQGRAYVYSGATGGILFSWTGTGHGTNLGASVDGGGDVNGDGWPDLLIGIQFADDNGGNSGTVRVHSGRTGSVIYAFHGDGSWDELGASVSFAGDVNGDGFEDVVAGARLADSGATNAGLVRVWSGADGSVLFTLTGSDVDENYGETVAGGGDHDGDGLSDVLVGWSHDGAAVNAGRAQAITGTPFPPTTYCLAKSNSNGCVPAISTAGTPSLSSTGGFLVEVMNVINDKPGILFYARHGGSRPFQGGMLCVRTPLARTPLQNSGGSLVGVDCTGTLSFDMNAWAQSGADPTIAIGDTLYAQYWYRDPAALRGSGFSDGVYFTMLP